MSKLKLCALALLIAGLVGCGGPEADEPAPEPTPSKPVRDTPPAASTAAPAPIPAPPATASMSSSEPQVLPPQVEQAQQSRLDEAWQWALAGQDPTAICSVVKSQALMGNPPERALIACNVDVPVRFFQTQLQMVQRGETSCDAVVALMQGQLPAMTMSLERLGELVRSGAAPTDGGASARAIATLSPEASGDSRQIVKERLYDSIVAICPGQAAAMMQ